MDLTLKRLKYESWGTVSSLLDENSNQIAVTLEHAYKQDNGLYRPKLNLGEHPCVFGEHMLDHGPVKTYEILNVPGHSGILFHIGNFAQKDSSGCVLLGTELGDQMIMESRMAFMRFLALQDQKDFTLTVVDVG